MTALVSLHFFTEVSQAKSLFLIHAGCKVSSGGYDLLMNSCSISQLAGSASMPGQLTFEFKGTFRDLVKKYLRIDLEICTVQMKYEVE